MQRLSTVLICAGFLCAATGAHAQVRKSAWGTLNYLVENDSFLNNSDKHYTSGLYVSWTSGELDACGLCGSLAKFLMLPRAGDSETFRYGYFVGQGIFTPSNIFDTRPDRRERPFAGWLLFGARLYRQSAHVLDEVSGGVGVVGHLSAADATQRWWHSLNFVSGIEPRGWVNQIGNEIGLAATAQRSWRVPIAEWRSVETELLPQVNGSIGNVFTYAGAGFNLRFGQRLRADWGPVHMRPASTGADFIDYEELHSFGWYVYAGMAVRAVLRNITLDGNSFGRSANVAKEPLVADLNLGAAILTDYVGLKLNYTKTSREFHTQRIPDELLSINLTVRY